MEFAMEPPTTCRGWRIGGLCLGTELISSRPGLHDRNPGTYFRNNFLLPCAAGRRLLAFAGATVPGADASSWSRVAGREE